MKERQQEIIRMSPCQVHAEHQPDPPPAVDVVTRLVSGL